MSRMKAVICRRRTRAAAAQHPSFQAFRLPCGAPDLCNFPPPQPCMRQWDRPWTAGDRQDVPARVRAPQRGAARSLAASAETVFSPVLIGVSFRFSGPCAAGVRSVCRIAHLKKAQEKKPTKSVAAPGLHRARREGASSARE